MHAAPKFVITPKDVVYVGIGDNIILPCQVKKKKKMMTMMMMMMVMMITMMTTMTTMTTMKMVAMMTTMMVVVMYIGIGDNIILHMPGWYPITTFISSLLSKYQRSE